MCNSYSLERVFQHFPKFTRHFLVPYIFHVTVCYPLYYLWFLFPFCSATIVFPFSARTSFVSMQIVTIFVTGFCTNSNNFNSSNSVSILNFQLLELLPSNGIVFFAVYRTVSSHVKYYTISTRRAVYFTISVYIKYTTCILEKDNQITFSTPISQHYTRNKQGKRNNNKLFSASSESKIMFIRWSQ